jgi:D-glycerate 3-kinase
VSANFESSHLLKWITEQRGQPGTRPAFFVGLSAPQGAGKSTLARQICSLAAEAGLNAIAISIDDFYLTRADQKALALRFADNPYLQHRGYPMTHDLELGRKTLTALRDGRPVQIPRYDKSAHKGQGDRAPQASWTTISNPPDIVLLEGWMLGFRPVPNEKLPNRQFDVLNRALAEYETWVEVLDAFIWLEPERIEDVVTWRTEAEEKVRASGIPTMSNDQIRRYIESFLPAYETYLPTIATTAISHGGMKHRPFLHLKVHRDRSLR